MEERLKEAIMAAIFDNPPNFFLRAQKWRGGHRFDYSR